MNKTSNDQIESFHWEPLLPTTLLFSPTYTVRRVVPFRMVLFNGGTAEVPSYRLIVEYLGTSFLPLYTYFNISIDNNIISYFYEFNRWDSTFEIKINRYLHSTEEYNATKSTTSSTSFIQSKIFIDLTLSIEDDYDSYLKTEKVGMVNLGATCYFNSLIQTLFNIYIFRSHIYSQSIKDIKQTQSDALILNLKKIFKALENNKDPVDPTEFLSKTKIIQNIHEHEDIDEFSKKLFDKIENELKKAMESKDNNKNNKIFLDDIFMGEIESFISGSCGCISKREEKFYDVSVEIIDYFNGVKYSSIEESLKNYTAVEHLTDNNKYKCNTHGLVDAKKGVVFKRIPDILFLLLKRFSMDYTTGETQKVNDYYAFEEEIDFSKYMHNISDETNPPNPNNIYKLYAIIVHSGNVSDGHYYVIINKNNKYYKFNDDVVTEISREEAIENNYGGKNAYKGYNKIYSAYSLVYVRKNKYDSMINKNMCEEESNSVTSSTVESNSISNIKYTEYLSTINLSTIGINMSYDYPRIPYKSTSLRSRIELERIISTAKRYMYIGIIKDRIYFYKDISDIKKDDHYFIYTSNIYYNFYEDKGSINNNINNNIINQSNNNKNKGSINNKDNIINQSNNNKNTLIIIKQYKPSKQCKYSFIPSLTIIDYLAVEDNKNIIEYNEYFEERNNGKEYILQLECTKEYKINNIRMNNTFKENEIYNGNIIIIVENKYKEELLEYYKYIKDRMYINFSTYKTIIPLFLERNNTYEDVRNRIREYTCNSKINISKFKRESSQSSNSHTIENKELLPDEITIDEYKKKIESNCLSLFIKNNYKIIYMGNSIVDYNNIKHIHILITREGMKVRELIKKYLMLDCEYNREYSNIKEYMVVDTVKNSNYIRIYNYNDIFNCYGLLVLEEISEYIKVVYYSAVEDKGSNTIDNIKGYPFILKYNKESKTIRDIRIKYKLTNKLMIGDIEIEDDIKLDSIEDIIYIIL